MSYFGYLTCEDGKEGLRCKIVHEVLNIKLSNFALCLCVCVCMYAQLGTS
jgi:hypothetical protein